MFSPAEYFERALSRMVSLIAAGVLFSLFEGCDSSFNASAPFQSRMVVYSVLTNESDTQYVRVYGTYNPPDNDPSKNLDEQSVTDADVRVSSDSALYQFRKIVLQRPDTSRYASDIVAYMCYPFRLARGKKYTLTVTSPSLGVATGATTVPGVAQVGPVNFSCLSDPYHSLAQMITNYAVEAVLSSQAKGYLAQIYVDYMATTVHPGVYQFKRRQIPSVVRIISKYQGTWEYIYPAIRRRASNNAGYRETELFNTAAWIFMGESDIFVYDGSGSLFLQAVFQVIQFDPPLYDTYSVAHLFRDRYSVRLDEADYTNISGGIGLFGSIAVDSSLWALPEHPFSQVGRR
jgi:hypothetical protein